MAIYLSLLLWVVGFKIEILFDLKMMVTVCAGTLLLTATACDRTADRARMAALICQNAFITGYLTSFICLFAHMTGDPDPKRLLFDVAMNCRPMFYGLILYGLFKTPGTDNTPAVPADPPPFVPLAADVPPPVPLPPDPLQKLKDCGLTERELEIALLIADGLSNREIGEQLFITETTVKKHSSNLYRKAGIANREQLKQLLGSDFSKTEQT